MSGLRAQCPIALLKHHENENFPPHDMATVIISPCLTEGIHLCCPWLMIQGHHAISDKANVLFGFLAAHCEESISHQSLVEVSRYFTGQFILVREIMASNECNPYSTHSSAGSPALNTMKSGELKKFVEMLLPAGCCDAAGHSLPPISFKSSRGRLSLTPARPL